MRILLTGSSGYIGGHLSMAFKNQSSKYEIEVLDPMIGSGGQPGMSWEKFVKDDLGVIKWTNYDWVIHCGALADAQADYPDIMGWNYEATRGMARKISFIPEHRRPKFLFFSSIVTYNPMGWYAWSKRVTEDMLRLQLPDAIIVRPCQVFGGDERPDRKSLVRKLLDGDKGIIFEDYTRDFVYVKDVCGAVVHIVKNAIKRRERIDDGDVFFGDTYDIGIGEVVKATQLAEMTERTDLEVITIDEAVAGGILKFSIPKMLFAQKPVPNYEYLTNVAEYIDLIKNRGYTDG